MIIKPKVRGFICTTTHPVGCAANVAEQIAYVKKRGQLANGPKKVLVIGASTGYGLASRINAAFGSHAATIGVFFEKAATERKTASAGWYNSAAFDKAAKAEGLYSKSINGDAFSHACREQVIDLIKQDTIQVMGGQDWELWMDALAAAGVLADGAKAVAYSYIGTSLTWPIYWHGTLGKAKEDLDRAAHAIDAKLKTHGGNAHVAVLKSVVTQASAAIPVMPLYISMAFKVMKEQGIHEGCIEQIQRLFVTQLYGELPPQVDEENRLRLDDWELRDAVQDACREIWSQVQDDNIYQLTDYQGYKDEFLRLFGFGLTGVDYEAAVDIQVDFEVIELA